MKQRPNILLILNDDMGFSDLGCFGGEIETPHLDALAAGGLRYTHFYNTARCCPSRASLLTGLHPHQAGVGHMTLDFGVDGYLGDLGADTVTLAEVLRGAGYRTYMSGKWHVTKHVEAGGPKHNWPCQRGFDDFYGILNGCGNFFNPGTLTRNNERIAAGEGYYMTDAFTDEAVRQIRLHAADHPGRPFFQYLAYTAPHWPLHAHEEDIAKYRGRFDAGWDRLREQRLARLKADGIVDCDLSGRDPAVPPWEDVPDKDWQARRMEVYAAQLDRMDQGIGRVIDALRETGQFENTLILFLSDNGGCAEGLPADPAWWEEKVREEHIATLRTRDGRPVRFGNTPDITPGGEETYSSYGVEWANLSNAPFRLYKHWVHEGGIATPLIAHWPSGIGAKGEIRHHPAQLPDLMATFMELSQARYPAERMGVPVRPHEGFSLLPTFFGDPHGRRVLCWEHEGNRAVRKGAWKLVRRFPGVWELFDIVADRSETRDLGGCHLDIVAELAADYHEWADRCGVRPWEEILEIRQKHSQSESSKKP